MAWGIRIVANEQANPAIIAQTAMTYIMVLPPWLMAWFELASAAVTIP